jgi:para-aminobenzoate synthetase / 4-amino-4-deoxychorismate lyase
VQNGDKAKAGRAVMGVGSAITADSEIMAEWRESVVKGGFVRDLGGDATMAAARFDLIETMAFTPETGVALLELHLARLTASAAELGFSWDRHAVRNAIQALCFAADAPAKLRLVVARSGAYTLEMAEMPPVLDGPTRCIILPLPVDDGDWRLRHKTSDRGFYEAGLRAAKVANADEALFIRDDGLMTEGCFTNIFVMRDGLLRTPPVAHGLLGGVLRASLLADRRAVEEELRIADLTDGFFIGNALRGLMPAVLK